MEALSCRMGRRGTAPRPCASTGLRRSLALLALLALAPLGAFAQSGAGLPGQGSAAQSGGLQIGGNLTDGALLLQNVDPLASPSLAGSSALTLNFVNANRSFAKVEGSVAVNLLYGAYADSYSATVAQAVGPTAPGLISLLTTQGAAVTVDLEKLYLEVYTRNADLSMGREIINFGVGTLFSPIDAFSRPTLTDLNFTRSGSDVLRVDLPFGAVSGAEAVTSFSDSLDTLVSALKLYTNLLNTDFAAVGLYRGPSRELLVGADFSGTLIAGVYGEAVEHLFLDGGQDYFEGMAGANYAFGNNTLVLTAEYYYNGNPVAPGSLTPAELAAARPIFLNRNYLYGSASYLLNTVMSLTGSLIYDLEAGSTLATLQYDWNLVQNADLLLYLRSVGGDIRSGSSSIGSSLQYGFQIKVSF